MLNMCSIPGDVQFSFSEAFGDVKLCFWRKPFPQIDGVPAPVERSCSSLTGVLHIYTEMVRSVIERIAIYFQIMV